VIRRLREERSLSSEELAELSRLTVVAYLRIEGGVSAPGWSTVRRIAEALGVSLRDLGELVEAEDQKG
jgi:transcriptional regulator with XRE-family HTH domain